MRTPTLSPDDSPDGRLVAALDVLVHSIGAVLKEVKAQVRDGRSGQVRIGHDHRGRSAGATYEAPPTDSQGLQRLIGGSGLITIREFQLLAGISPTVYRKHRSRGHLPTETRENARRIFISRTDLASWLTAQTQQPGSAVIGIMAERLRQQLGNKLGARKRRP